MNQEQDTSRSAFPSLTDNQKLVFFDNAAGSQTLGTVISSISDYFAHYNVQLGASYAVSSEATAIFKKALVECAGFINARPDEIVLGPSTTQLLRNLSTAIKLKPGDEIIVSAVDHEANIAPWVDLAERCDLALKWWRPQHATNPKLVASDLKTMLSRDTKLVTLTHASNILGTITDVRAVADVAHAAGALVCVDGVGFAAHRPIDVQQLGVDFYCLSWYKLYGPHMAMLYASRPAQQHLRSLGHFFIAPTSLRGKMGLSGASYELVQSLPHVVEYLGPAGSPMWKAAIAQETRLQSILLGYLGSRTDVTVYGDPSDDPRVRLSTVCFAVKGWNCRQLVREIEERSGYFVRAGCNHADRLVRELLGRGKDGVVRVSMLHYNTVDEVSGFIKLLDTILLDDTPQPRL